jgi:hypothetical protein
MVVHCCSNDIGRYRFDEIFDGSASQRLLAARGFRRGRNDNHWCMFAAILFQGSQNLPPAQPGEAKVQHDRCPAALPRRLQTTDAVLLMCNVIALEAQDGRQHPGNVGTVLQEQFDRRSSGFMCLQSARQGEGKQGAALRRAAGHDLTAVGPHNRPGYPETKPCAFGAAIGRSAVEALEQAVSLAGIETGPVVADGERHVTASVFQSHLDRALASVLPRVIEQVTEDLADAPRVEHELAALGAGEFD